MRTNLKEFLNNIYPIDETILGEYLMHWEEYQVPKKTIITEPGKTEKYLYFVLDGVQKSYYLNDAKQHVIMFTYPPSFTGIPESFLSQAPSKYFLETITASKFLRISYEKHAKLMEEYRPIETLFRKEIEFLLIGVLNRYFEIMALDMETRFKEFTKRSPHLLQIISQKDLASYLKIDPTNFSKLINSIHI